MSQGLVGWVARERQTALVIDTEQDERWLALPTEDADALGAGRADRERANLVGCPGLDARRSRPISPTDHVRLMEAAADQMALAIRNARSFEAAAPHGRSTDDAVRSAARGQRSIESGCDRADGGRRPSRTLPVGRMWRSLLADADGRHWIVRAVSGEPSLPLGLCAAHRARHHPRRPVHVPHASAGRPRCGLTRLTTRSPDAVSLVVPLWQGGTFDRSLEHRRRRHDDL